MSLTDELERLQALHDSGALTDAEFANAKAKVLAEPAPQAAMPNSGVQRDLRRLQLQNEILSLDQNWSQERQSYLLRGRYNSGVVPTTASTLVQAAILVTFGIVFFAAGFPSGMRPSPLPYIGFILFMLGIGVGVLGSIRVKAYEEAHEQYQQKRQELTDQLAALGRQFGYTSLT